MCFLNWKAKGTPQGRLYFQLAPSTPRTDETGCGYLPTPTASDANTHWNDKIRYDSLSAEINRQRDDPNRMWPTPSAGMHKQDVNDSGRYARDIKEKGFQIMLPAEFVKMWPTPKAQDCRGGSGKNVQGGASLTDQVRLWPTPAARDYKGARKPETMEKTGRNAETNSLPDSVEFREASGRLNPTWVEWLMGYPSGWTDLKPSETPSSHK
jgi:hypothetical protein